jgi:hypothetical protein
MMGVHNYSLAKGVGSHRKGEKVIIINGNSIASDISEQKHTRTKGVMLLLPL